MNINEIEAKVSEALRLLTEIDDAILETDTDLAVNWKIARVASRVSDAKSTLWNLNRRVTKTKEQE
jgi:hypothetical protein